MDATTQTVENTVVSALEAAAPALIAGAAATSPAASSAAVLAPIAIQFLQSAVQMQNVGLLTPDQLASTFASIGQQVAATHAAWAALPTPAK